MAQVSVTINGRRFNMACEDGQEDHLTALAREFDTRIEGLRSKFGDQLIKTVRGEGYQLTAG